MSILDELDVLRRSVILWVLLFILLSSFFFFFAVRQTTVYLPFWHIPLTIFIPIPTPIPTPDTLSLFILKIIQKDLLPSQIELIVISPIDVVLAQIGVSLALGFVITLPYLFYQLFSFLSPALHKRERKILIYAIIPAFLLFLGGCVFSYFFFIPFTFKILYTYVLAIGVKPFYEMSQFISLVIMITLICGIIFLLPILMIGLSILGIVELKFWREHWRLAVLTFVIFSAIITPDNTGITMIFISFILAFLYFLGYYGSWFILKRISPDKIGMKEVKN